VILLYPIIVFDSINKTNPVNFMIYIVSFIVFLYAVYSIKEKNINSYNIFLFGFFIALFLNTLNASTKQLEKELIDMYYYFLGPLLVASMLYFFENLKIKKVSFRNIIKFDVNSVYVFLVIFYIVTKSYMLQWSLLIFLPFVKKSMQ